MIERVLHGVIALSVAVVVPRALVVPAARRDAAVLTDCQVNPNPGAPETSGHRSMCHAQLGFGVASEPLSFKKTGSLPHNLGDYNVAVDIAAKFGLNLGVDMSAQYDASCFASPGG